MYVSSDLAQTTLCTDLIVQSQRGEVRDLLGPLHQRVALLLSCHLKFTLQISPKVGSAQLRLGFLTNHLRLQDPVSRHVGRAEPQAAVKIIITAAPLTSPPVTPLLLDGLPLHAHGDTLVVPTELAPVPLPLVHQAVLVLATGVGQLFTNCSLEETLEIH